MRRHAEHENAGALQPFLDLRRNAVAKTDFPVIEPDAQAVRPQPRRDGEDDRLVLRAVAEEDVVGEIVSHVILGVALFSLYVVHSTYVRYYSSLEVWGKCATGRGRRIASRSAPLRQWAGEELAGAGRDLAWLKSDLAGAGRELASPGEELAGAGRELASPGKELAGPKSELASPGEELAGAGRELASPGRELAGAGRELAWLKSELAWLESEGAYHKSDFAWADRGVSQPGRPVQR
jgi:hypothetical protein